MRAVWGSGSGNAKIIKETFQREGRMQGMGGRNPGGLPGCGFGDSIDGGGYEAEEEEPVRERA